MQGKLGPTRRFHNGATGSAPVHQRQPGAAGSKECELKTTKTQLPGTPIGTTAATSARWADRSARLALGASIIAALLGLAACAVEMQNTRAAEELARRAEPPGSVYVGWRVFQERCAACHGPDAQGSAYAPNLQPRLRDMGARRFVSLVLTRYDWSRPALQPGTTAGAAGKPPSDSTVDEVLLRRQGSLAMPAWQGEPQVSAHILDLYAYLSARAQGTQGPGRPTP